MTVLKLAGEVQGAGDDCLGGSFKPGYRSEVRVKGQVQQQRHFCVDDSVCCGCTLKNPNFFFFF